MGACLIMAGMGWVAAAEQPPAPAPGEEFLLPRPEATQTVRVYCPRGYHAGRAWPLVVYYPGTGGRPDTGFVRRYAGDEDFLIVGMPFVYNGDNDPAVGYEPEQVDPDCAFLLEVLDQLARRVRIDPACILVCGVSKGGWAAAAVGERLHRRIAGWAVLAAGRPRLGLEDPPPAALRGKPIYLGVGEHDPNLFWSQRGDAFYQTRDARVILDVYPDIGHSVPGDMPLLRAWFRAVGPLRLRYEPEAARAEMQQWLSDTTDRVRDTGDPLDRYRQLRTVSRDARVYLSGPRSRQWLQEQLAQARSQSPVREEWAAEQEYYRILLDGFEIRSLDHMEQIANAYGRLADQYPRTQHGAWAAERYTNTVDALAASREATREANQARRSNALARRPARVPRLTPPTVTRGGR